MEIIRFSDKPSPFPPVDISKIPEHVLIQIAKDVRKNKPKEDTKTGTKG